MPLEELYESCKYLITLNHSEFTPRILDFRNDKEEVSSNSGITDNGIEKELECENCKKSFKRKSLLKHISHRKDCKEFYGSRFEHMKKEQTKRTYKECYNRNPDPIRERARKRAKDAYETNPEPAKRRSKEA